MQWEGIWLFWRFIFSSTGRSDLAFVDLRCEMRASRCVFKLSKSCGDAPASKTRRSTRKLASLRPYIAWQRGAPVFGLELRAGRSLHCSDGVSRRVPLRGCEPIFHSEKSSTDPCNFVVAVRAVQIWESVFFWHHLTRAAKRFFEPANRKTQLSFRTGEPKNPIE